MGFPTSEVGYTPAMPRREDHEVHKSTRTCGGIGKKFFFVENEVGPDCGHSQVNHICRKF